MSVPPALTLFYCMERFHCEPLPFSQAGLGQYQSCALETGHGTKAVTVLFTQILAGVQQLRYLWCIPSYL